MMLNRVGKGYYGWLDPESKRAMPYSTKSTIKKRKLQQLQFVSISFFISNNVLNRNYFKSIFNFFFKNLYAVHFQALSEVVESLSDEEISAQNSNENIWKSLSNHEAFDPTVVAVDDLPDQ